MNTFKTTKVINFNQINVIVPDHQRFRLKYN